MERIVDLKLNYPFLSPPSYPLSRHDQPPLIDQSPLLGSQRKLKKRNYAPLATYYSIHPPRLELKQHLLRQRKEPPAQSTMPVNEEIDTWGHRT
ncbi:hypothetical protein COCNU_scaffold038272G000010 [Cocos nucifera]|nr:hypothetical protein [Cocos nucifera]EHA8591232.1 hypothetical protein [Cocos nucifera]